jgi:uncharacterized alkaline shock family protein YloU
MAHKIQNEYGTVTISNDVIANIAGITATNCYGIVGMAAKSVRDGLVRLLKRENLARGVKVRAENGAINVDLHVIAEYGTNIAVIGETAISNVKYMVEDMTSLKVGGVNFFVEGLRVN